MIAAYANQRNEENRTPQTNLDDEQDRTQWAEGNAANQTDLADAVGGFENRVYFGERSPEYSVVGKADEGDSSVELDLQRSTTVAPEVGGAEEDEEPAAAEGNEGTTTYDGAGGVPVGSTFRQLLYAIRFGVDELPAVRTRATRTPRCSTTATPRSGSARSRRG